MTDLRPAQDVAAEITRCEEGRMDDHDAQGRVIARGLPYCVEHGEEGWPCPELTRVTALIEADRRAAMAKAWDEGFTKAGRLLLGMDDDAWPPASNPYEAADNGGCDPPCT